MSTLPIADIRREPELQCRARGTNARTVREYADAAKAGATFPPVVVFKDSKGVHWLADGFHRVAAAELAGVAEIAVDVRDGDRKAALLHAASANSDHGLRRTLADKRAAVKRLLEAYPKWSDRKIAEAAKVDHKTVGAARKAAAVVEGGEFPTPPGTDEAMPEPTLVDLAPIYARGLLAYPNHAPVEHLRAFVRALVELNGDATREQIAEWISGHGSALAPRRRRIIEPRGAAATNGAE
jgi:ParB-like chromosome segregation protein Spo0J